VNQCQFSDNKTPHVSKYFDKQVLDTIPYYESFHKETINLIKAAVIQPEIWLDTGCGTGGLVEAALNEFPYTKFRLADPSPGMLKQAAEKLSKHPPSRVEFLGSLPTQNLPPELCGNPDIITAIQSHHYLSFEDREKATKICYNLLKKDGVYLTFENIRPATGKGVEIGKNYWKNFQFSRGRDIETVENHMKRFGVEYFPITVEEHLSLLKKTGFRVVELIWFSYMQAGFYGIK
jgi:tRNA (cmo5U34)-methyltransferase